LGVGLAAATGSASANQEVRNITVTAGGVVIPPLNCPNGVGPDNKCLPPVVVGGGASKDWNATAMFSDGVKRPVPAEIMDGDSAQKGWNGNSSWTQARPKFEFEGECMRYELISKAPQGVPANQIVVVSRQDDPANAVEPTASTEFTKYGFVDFELRASTDMELTSLDPPFIVRDNNKVMVTYDFPTATINHVSLFTCKTANGSTSPLAEILIREKK